MRFQPVEVVVVVTGTTPGHGPPLEPHRFLGFFSVSLFQR